MSDPTPTRVTFLGTGSSSGVPGVGIGWGACDPANPKNARTRQSVLIEHAGKRLLIDTSPDLRTQLLRVGNVLIDAVLFTHAHADHLHGIDDLRGINKAIKRPLPVYADAETHKQIHDRFGYTLKPLGPNEPKVFVRPVLDMTEFVPGDDIDVLGVTVGTFEQDHGFSTTVGFEIGPVVYSTDVRDLTDDVLVRLRDRQIGVWIIGVFQWNEHWTHAHVDKALEWIEQVKPKRAILTHLGPAIDHDELSRALPNGVAAAFDGMTVEISNDDPDAGKGILISD